MDSGGLVGAHHADERAAVDLAPAPRAGPEPQRARWYSWSLFAIACLAGLLLAASGAPMPPVWVVVVLGVLIALSLHHVAFFPSQWSATAEAAVLLAAVVGFAGAAADQGAGAATVLGPWAVAFLCGPLDTLHWKEHAFWRMAFNAGNRMIAVLLATLAFNGAHGISRPLFGGGVPWGPFAAAALAASVVFALVDLVLFLGFERFGRGESVRAALREYVVVDSLTVPLGLVGAGAGYLALRLGWWAGALALVPVPFAPELILVRARRAVHGARLTRAMRDVAPIATGALVLIGLFAFLVELPDPVQLAGLVVVALVAGIEIRVDARMQVPAMIATLVAGALLLDGEDAFAAAVVLAVTATATACLFSRRRTWWPPLLAAGATLVAASVFDARPSRAGALAAALAFELVMFVRVPTIVWTAPIVGAAVALGYTSRTLGSAGVAVFGAGLVAAGAAAVALGAPPWSSRVLWPFVTRRTARRHRMLLVALVAVTLTFALSAEMISSAREPLVSATAAAAAAVAAMAMLGVRQWRFAPRRRTGEAGLVLVSVVAGVLAYPPLALRGSAWSAAILSASLTVSTLVAWPLARLADDAAPRTRAPNDARALRR